MGKFSWDTLYYKSIQHSEYIILYYMQEPCMNGSNSLNKTESFSVSRILVQLFKNVLGLVRIEKVL